MEMPSVLHDTVVVGNELWRVLMFAVALLAALMGGRIAKHFLHQAGTQLTEKSRPLVGVLMVALGRTATFVAITIAIRFGISALVLSQEVEDIALAISDALFVVAIAYMLYAAVDIVEHWLANLSSKTESKLDDMLIPLVRKTLRVTIVVLAMLQIATIFSDKPLTSLLAGLGVGGLAVALAAQETVKNFFGSLVLFGDKPFELGDRIVVDGYDGSVEEVGFRSTRVRTLDGHLVTIPNGELANKCIQNISLRPNIKQVLNLGLTYDTPPVKVERAVEILKELLADHEGMNEDVPPMVYFNAFKDSSLNILAIYWYHPADYHAFSAFNEKLHLNILKSFNEEGIEFAFPSQTLYLGNSEASPAYVKTV
jgi:MscS family membrane protein